MPFHNSKARSENSSLHFRCSSFTTSVANSQCNMRSNPSRRRYGGEFLSYMFRTYQVCLERWANLGPSVGFIFAIFPSVIRGARCSMRKELQCLLSRQKLYQQCLLVVSLLHYWWLYNR